MNPTPLKPQAVSRLRHDLRTYVNHLQGYGEMVLESLEDEDLPDLSVGASTLLAVGRELTDLIHAGLPSSEHDLPAETIPKIVTTLETPVSCAEATLAKIIPLADANQLEEIAADLRKIERAIGDLRGFLASNLTRDVHQDAPINAREPLPSSASRTANPTATTQARILIVDDIENNRDMLRRRLEREGHFPLMASNGKEALTLIEAGGLDLVLLDILMPEMDGFLVLERVKSNPASRDLPIIMISSLDEIDSVVRCIEMGAEDFLPKPFDPVLLRARVNACLEKKRNRDKELAYLHNVALVTTAAAAIEAGQFDPRQLESVAQRQDELGRLARVFERMGREVQAREDRLKTQVLQLKIEIDETRKKTQVAEVTETEYFQDLQRRAETLRKRARKET